MSHSLVMSDRKYSSYHLVVGGVTGASCRFGLPLAGLLGVWEEVQLHVGVRVCAVLQGLLHTPHTHTHSSVFKPVTSVTSPTLKLMLDHVTFS